MHVKTYPEAKRRILLERNVEDFVTFLEEVTDSQGRTFIRNRLLPRTVTGFRPGHAPLTLTVPKFISNLREEQELTNPNSRKWDMFNDAWKSWVVSHGELNNVLLQFDNTEDFDENQQCIVPPNSELDRKCFEVLMEASCNNQIDQETIQRFYEYGYFNEDKQIEDLIDKALPREEIERKQQIEQLPDQVNGLRQEIDDFHTQISNLEPLSELQQLLDQHISEVQQSFEEQIAQLKVSQNVSRLKQLINSLKSNISEVNESLKSRIGEVENSQAEIHPAINDFVDYTEETIAQLEKQIQDANESVKERFDAIKSDISEIKSEAEKQNRQPVPQITNEVLKNGEHHTVSPRIAHKAIEIGKHYAAKLEGDIEHYQDEEDYLSVFQFSLRRFGITDSKETATAIHVALKTFPGLEITDKRLIKVWHLMCDNHLYYTNMNVEMGWIGLQDWFPDFFADECFGECLKRIDLEVSVRKMLEIGNMPWAIHFGDCDRSFPEGYLPSFIKWIKGFSECTIKIFLTRCLGKNRCEITEDAYALLARLPEPQEEEPIEAQNLRSSGIIVTHSDWEVWCRPPPDVDQHLQNQFDILDQLRSTIEQNSVRIPITPLQEIRHYLRLSQSIEMAPTRALDWALRFRLLPWIEKRPEVIDSVLDMLDQEDHDLSNSSDELQKARDNANESN